MDAKRGLADNPTMSVAGQALVREKHSLAMGRRMLAEAIEAALRHKLGVA